jgi:fructose-bisphosphate aldolase, class I
MEKIQISKLQTNGKSVFLAYDAGLEHGPSDFNLKNCDPQLIVDTAEKAKVNGVIFQHGIAEKYYKRNKHQVPLIIKLNGKTKLHKGEPYSPQICSVDRAVRLGADAVGYTIYAGSKYESIMFKEFSLIVEKAHKLGMPVILWSYPRCPGLNEDATETIAYAARVALETGADFAKIKFNRDLEGFKWAVKCAGKTKVVMVGGSKGGDIDFLTKLSEAMKAGASGIAVGRNIWQHDNPVKILEAVKEIVYNNKTPKVALKKLK